jgi:hypothetical protein
LQHRHDQTLIASINTYEQSLNNEIKSYHHEHEVINSDFFGIKDQTLIGSQSCGDHQLVESCSDHGCRYERKNDEDQNDTFAKISSRNDATK